MTYWLSDSMCMEPFECHVHRPKQVCGKKFLLPKKWLIVTYVDNVPEVLFVIIGKIGSNFWLVMDEITLGRRKAPGQPTRPGIGSDAEESRCSEHDAPTT